VRDADGEMVRRASEVTSGAALDIEFADGHVGALADARPRKLESERKKKRGDRDKQGTLL
jgi:exodeoxyribonuclease VII large subunit